MGAVLFLMGSPVCTAVPGASFTIHFILLHCAAELLSSVDTADGRTSSMNLTAVSFEEVPIALTAPPRGNHVRPYLGMCPLLLLNDAFRAPVATPSLL